MNQLETLSDAQLCALHLLAVAHRKGVTRVSRDEISNNESVPLEARIKLSWALLTMPSNLMTWHHREAAITRAGIDAIEAKWPGALLPDFAERIVALAGSKS